MKLPLPSECMCILCTSLLKPWCSIFNSNFVPNYVNEKISDTCPKLDVWLDLLLLKCCCIDPHRYGINLCADYFCRHVYAGICTCLHCTPRIKRRLQVVQLFDSTRDYVFCRHATLSCRVNRLHATYCACSPLCTCHSADCICKFCHEKIECVCYA